MVVVACCCCILYRLALMLAPTFAPCVLTFAPYILTFGPCACGVSLRSTGANIPLAQVVVVTSCNLRSWCFFTQPLAQIVHLHTWWYHPLQLALVVLFHSATSADSPLAHVVVSPSATCAGGAFSSSHWRKYCTCTRATCTVWWWSVVVVHSCMWRWRYIHMKPALPLEQLALCGGNLQW